MIEMKEVWLDGKLIDWKEGTLPISILSSATFHYGMGGFEGIRVYNDAIFCLEEHVTRLYNTAEILQIEIPFRKTEIRDGIIKTIVANNLHTGYIRPIVFSGPGDLGLSSVYTNPIQVAILVWPWGTYLGEKGLKEGISLKTSTFIKASNSTPFRAKACGNYVLSVLAKHEAKAEGYNEALLLDESGNIAEASAENFFMVQGGELITPPIDAPILGGITREKIITLAEDLGIDVNQRKIVHYEPYSAEECFLTGTAAEVVPVRELDDRKIGNGKVGPITREIQNLFFKVVKGQVEEYRSWLTPIDIPAKP